MLPSPRPVMMADVTSMGFDPDQDNAMRGPWAAHCRYGRA